MYRFLLSPRWLGLALVMILASATMVGLGLWQLDRYHTRSAINNRIDAASRTAPVPLETVLAAPPAASAGAVGQAPPSTASWVKVTVTGRYDPGHEILARSRTVDSQVGFEVLTPLILANGAAVLIDRGWVPPTGLDATVPPEVPAAPAGQVTVVGRIRPAESRAGAPERFGDVLSVRRIDPARVAEALPYPVYGGYITVDAQTPPADPRFVSIAPSYENAWMNAGYVVQWWLLAALALVGYGYLAVREARNQTAGSRPDGRWDGPDEHRGSGGDPDGPGGGPDGPDGPERPDGAGGPGAGQPATRENGVAPKLGADEVERATIKASALERG